MFGQEKFKTREVSCPACKALNPLGRPFCRTCGARMYAGADRLPPPGERRPPRVRAVRAGAASFVLVCCAVVFGLMLWPFEPLGSAGSAAEAGHAQRVLLQVQRDLTAESSWRGYAVAESGWNAFADLNIPEPMRLRVSASGEQVVAVAVNERFGLRFSTRVVMVPSGQAGYFVPYSLWLGHLPLPGRFAGRVARSRAAALGLQVEEVFWERVRIERVEGSTMILMFRDREDG